MSDLGGVLFCWFFPPTLWAAHLPGCSEVMSELSGETLLEAAESADFQIDSSLKGFCLGEISVRAGVPPPPHPSSRSSCQ